MWENLRDEGVSPACVQLLGIGGGPLTEVEFRVALALGASTAAVHCTGGAADALLNDDAWRNTPLLGLPHDIASVQAFVTAPAQVQADGEVEKMAISFHENYREIGAQSLPENMRPWPDLPDTYKGASRAQSAYAAEILRAAGFAVRSATGGPDAIRSFDGPEFTEIVEHMAEQEHGRWNVDRLRNGWRFGRPRDNARNLHDCIVPWSELPENIRDYDRKSIRAFPDILAKAELEIFRK